MSTTALPEMLVKQTQEEYLQYLYRQATELERLAKATTDPATISAYEGVIDSIIDRIFLKHERDNAPTMSACMAVVEPVLRKRYDPKIIRETQGNAQAHLVSERDNLIRLDAARLRQNYIRDILEKNHQLLNFQTEVEREV